MAREFTQIEWDNTLLADLRQLIRLAVAEDLGKVGDLTTNALAPEASIGAATIVARSPGVVAGLGAAGLVAEKRVVHLVAFAAPASQGRESGGGGIARMRSRLRGMPR